MALTHVNTASNYETHSALSHPLMSWRSTVAGLIIAFFVHVTLMSLGLALGGVSLQNASNPDASTAGIIGGVWFLVSCLISLFVGSYMAARVSKFHTSRIAGAQGVVITALFFGVMFWQIGNIVAFVGNAAGSAASTAANAAAVASQNPELQNRVESATSGVTGTEVQNQINQLREQATGMAPQAIDTAAATMQTVGWSLFVSMVLGALASFGGGALAAIANVRRPLLIETPVTGMAGAAI